MNKKHSQNNIMYKFQVFYLFMLIICLLRGRGNVTLVDEEA